MKDDGFEVRPVTEADQGAWRELFDGYAEFYRVPMTDAIAQKVWSWLLDPTHVLEGVVAQDRSGAVIGLAHFRACPRTLGGSDIGFLDDLFVTPKARGSGAADALLSYLGRVAQERGWPAVRWLTQHFNERGRGFYDRYTHGPSDFIVYHWAQH